MIYQIGDVAPLTVTFTNLSGAAADPTTVTLTVQAPDNTQTVISGGSITHVSTGVYSYNLPIAQSGTVGGGNNRYLYKWTGTGAVAEVEEGAITVQPTTLVPQPAPILPSVWTNADIVAIDAALKSGVLHVQLDGRAVTFRSVQELMTIRALAVTLVASASGMVQRRQYHMFSAKGYGG